MRLFIKIFFGLLISVQLHGQQTFNLRYGLGLASISYGVIVLEDGYIISGDIVEDLQKSYLIKISTDGDVVWIKEYTTAFNAYHFRKTIQWTAGGQILEVAVSINEEGKHENHLLWFMPDGELLNFTTELSEYYNGGNPFYSGENPDWYTTRHLSQDEEGNIYSVSLLSYPWILVRKYNSEGVEIWSNKFRGQIGEIQPDIGTITYDSGFVYFSKQELFDGINDVNSIIKMDANSGIQVDSISLPTTQDVNGMNILDDGYIIASRVRVEGAPTTKFAILRIDEQGEELWSLEYGAGTVVGSIVYGLLPTSDGNYVAAGDYLESFPADSIVNGSYNTKVVLSKFTENGEEIWVRKFAHVTSFQDKHSFSDLKPTPDGGYIFCGVAQDADINSPNFEAPGQRIWVVKVDACGCLVPGCDPDCDATPSPPISGDDFFIASPSPSNGPINLYLKPLEQKNLSITVHDLSGKLIHQIDQAQGDVTYMMDLSSQAQGIYLISLHDGSRILQSERVLISRE